jgi:AcrR family transcriptional regulator
MAINMTRVAMDPEARRSQIVDVSLELFDRKGYERTTISDIVKRAKVAQGTFYYYFKSKDEILNAIIERWIIELKKVLQEVVQDDKMDAVHKFFNSILQIQKISVRHRILAEYVHEKKNEILYSRLMRESKLTVAPFLEEIIRQGMKEGTIHTQYPKEATMAFLGFSDFLGHELKSTQETDQLRLMNAVMELTERIFGMERGTLSKIYELLDEDYREHTKRLEKLC